MDEKHIELEPFIVSSRSFLMFPYLGVVTEIKSNSLSVFYLIHTNSVLVHNLKVTNSKSYSLCNNRLHESTYWKLAGNYLVHYACILEVRKNIDPANGRRYFADTKNHIINDSNRYTSILT